MHLISREFLILVSLQHRQLVLRDPADTVPTGGIHRFASRRPARLGRSTFLVAVPVGMRSGSRAADHWIE
jgi:hypothetical protein